MDASSLDLPAGFVAECVPMPFGLATEAEGAVAYALALDPADAAEMARDIVSMSAENAVQFAQLSAEQHASVSLLGERS
jgi:hypothetical protein